MAYVNKRDSICAHGDSFFQVATARTNGMNYKTTPPYLTANEPPLLTSVTSSPLLSFARAPCCSLVPIPTPLSSQRPPSAHPGGIACRHHHRTQLNPRNRLSKFTYVEGDPSATRQSEVELVTTVPKLTGIHAAGWLDFEPGAFNNVSRRTNSFCPFVVVVPLSTMG